MCRPSRTQRSSEGLGRSGPLRTVKVNVPLTHPALDRATSVRRPSEAEDDGKGMGRGKVEGRIAYLGRESDGRGGTDILGGSWAVGGIYAWF